MSSISSVETFDDPEAYAARIHNAYVRLRPARAGAYRARLTLVRLSSAHLSDGEENLPRRLTCGLAPDRVFFHLKHADEPPNVRNGRLTEPGTVGLMRRGADMDDRTEGATRWRSVSMPLAELTARAETLSPRSLRSLLGASDHLRPMRDDFARLADLQTTALRLATEAPAVLAHPVAGKALDERIGEAMLAILDGAGLQEATRAERRHCAIMCRAMDFIEANEARPIGLGELCSVVGCSARLLERLFREFCGDTPNRHLRLRRLWGARRALLAADPRVVTVSTIALDWGFWELGRFAVAYRAQFGESPSQTLRSGCGAAASPTRAA